MGRRAWGLGRGAWVVRGGAWSVGLGVGGAWSVGHEVGRGDGRGLAWSVDGAWGVGLGVAGAWGMGLGMGGGVDRGTQHISNGNGNERNEHTHFDAGRSGLHGDAIGSPALQVGLAVGGVGDERRWQLVVGGWQLGEEEWWGRGVKEKEKRRRGLGLGNVRGDHP
ncbi:glycine-rich cell wall structural protein 1-like [Impatiens glandulifera]|uniref:glycine-rich cell wall structural protein 1-like n=1 Tax=Impatiens glandulifera TaxID=253017 RepID=UPI001FB13C85|nr:glycine-rich cell wall structural protein 1-like [Impatiens glandulifera]